MGNLVPAQNSISQSLSEMCEVHRERERGERGWGRECGRG